MKQIIIIGAGRSTLFLVEYLAKFAEQHNWQITVADRNLKLAEARCSYSRTIAMELDIENESSLSEAIASHDIVISMLPARLHMAVALQCLEHKKNLCTASYLTDEMRALDEDVKAAGLIFLNEIGLDPGIDHLSAMSMIDNIKAEGGNILEFESFTGGLVAPESDDNPWNYKFTWNPRNVILAGQGDPVKFIQNGRYKFIPYHKLFRRTEVIDIDGHGRFEGYANRDSLTYRETYGLDDVLTMYRGTLRRQGFCKAWDQFVQLGATDDTYILPESEKMSHREFINTFLGYNQSDSVEIKLRQYLRIEQDDVDLWHKLVWLDLFSNEKIGIPNATPAKMLEEILKKKWSLSESDKDMIVMWHKLVYSDTSGNKREIHSSMVVKGETGDRTAMAKTVGYPLGMACKLILNGEISKKGTVLPITPDIYQPILKELATVGVSFNEKIIS